MAKTTKAKVTAISSNINATDPDFKIKSLDRDLSALNVSQEVHAEVISIALDVGGLGGRSLTATDMAQLRDLAVVSMRINTITPRLDELFINDPKVYCAVVSKVQNDGALRRGCLRDLRATRTARGTVKDESEDVSQWNGVV